jgi:hypothetical protein
MARFIPNADIHRHDADVLVLVNVSVLLLTLQRWPRSKSSIDAIAPAFENGRDRLCV